MYGLDRRTVLALAGTAAVAAAAPAAFAAPARTLEVLPLAPQAPALGLEDLSGKRYEVAGLKGRTVLLAFWATWCPPCLREMPALQNLRARLLRDDIEVLTVNSGEAPERIERFLMKSGIEDLPVLLDRDETVANRWFVGLLPLAYAIDRNGIVRLGRKGEVDWNSPEIDAQLRALAGT